MLLKYYKFCYVLNKSEGSYGVISFKTYILGKNCLKPFLSFLIIYNFIEQKIIKKKL